MIERNIEVNITEPWSGAGRSMGSCRMRCYSTLTAVPAISFVTEQLARCAAKVRVHKRPAVIKTSFSWETACRPGSK